MEGTNKREDRVTNQEPGYASLETLSRVDEERNRLVEKLTAQAEALTARFPFAKGKIEGALKKSLTSLRLVVGASVLAMASQGAFAQETSNVEPTKIDTFNTASEVVTGDAGNAADLSEVLLEERTSSSNEDVSDDSEHKESTYPDTDISDIHTKALEQRVAGLEERTRDLPKLSELDLREQIEYAKAICTYVEEAADCAEAMIQALVNGKQANLKNTLNQLEKAETIAEKKKALENLFRELPGLGAVAIEKLYNKIPLIEALDIAPNIDGTPSKAGKILVERVHTITDDKTSIKEKTLTGIDIATDTPVLARLLAEKNPLLVAVAGIKEVYAELRREKPDPARILKSLGKFALNKITFGLGSFMIEAFDDPKKVEKPEEKTVLAENTQQDQASFSTPH